MEAVVTQRYATPGAISPHAHARPGASTIPVDGGPALGLGQLRGCMGAHAVRLGMVEGVDGGSLSRASRGSQCRLLPRSRGRARLRWTAAINGAASGHERPMAAIDGGCGNLARIAASIRGATLRARGTRGHLRFRSPANVGAGWGRVSRALRRNPTIVLVVLDS